MSNLIVANWKSHKTPATALEWCKAFRPTIPPHTQVVVAPSFPLLPVIADNLAAGVSLGAQDVSSFPLGSYTGATAAQQLASANVSHVIIGHSERRRYFHETHQDVAAKLEQVVANNLIPILCMDEEYILDQAEALHSQKVPNLVVAYEPLAAIGTGNNVSVDQVSRVIDTVKQVYGDVPVIYGGSVDERSVHEYLLVSDGVLVGTASLDAQQFAKVVEAST